MPKTAGAVRRKVKHLPRNVQNSRNEFCKTSLSLRRRGLFVLDAVTALQYKNVTIQDGASSCPAEPDKKHRRFLRCENKSQNVLTSKLDAHFRTYFPAVLNSYTKSKQEVNHSWQKLN